MIIPVSEKFSQYAEKVAAKLLSEEIRVRCNNDSETLGKRIAEAEKMKIPYILVVGQKEMDNETVTVRRRSVKEQSTLTTDAFIEEIKSEIQNKL